MPQCGAVLEATGGCLIAACNRGMASCCHCQLGLGGFNPACFSQSVFRYSTKTDTSRGKANRWLLSVKVAMLWGWKALRAVAESSCSSGNNWLVWTNKGILKLFINITSGDWLVAINSCNLLMYWSGVYSNVTCMLGCCVSNCCSSCLVVATSSALPQMLRLIVTCFSGVLDIVGCIARYISHHNAMPTSNVPVISTQRC